MPPKDPNDLPLPLGPSEVEAPIEPDSLVLAGVLAPTRSRASFVTPVFVGEDGAWVQKLEKGRIAGFEKLPTSGVDVLALPESSDHVSVTKQAEPVYAFAFAQDDVVAAPRRKLARILSSRIWQLREDPLVRLDVSQFIGDDRKICRSIKAAANEIAAIDWEVARSFFRTEYERKKCPNSEGWERIAEFTFALLRFFKGYSRFVHLGGKERSANVRARYEQALDDLEPLVFDVELAQLLQERIWGPARERAHPSNEFRAAFPTLPERRIRALTKAGVSRTAAKKLLTKAMTVASESQVSEQSLIEAARNVVFGADRALREQVRVARGLERAEKKIRKRQLRIGILSIAYGVILLLQAIDQTREPTSDYVDLGHLGLSAITAGLRDLAPGESLRINGTSSVAVSLEAGASDSSQ